MREAPIYLATEGLGKSIDFPALFRSNLATWKSGDAVYNRDHDFPSLGIRQVSRDLPVNLYKHPSPNERSRYVMYIMPSYDKNISNANPHQRTGDAFREFRIRNNIQVALGYPAHGYVIQDHDDRLTLLLEGDSFDSMRGVLETASSLWEPFCEEYGIDKVITPVKEMAENDDDARLSDGRLVRVPFDYVGIKRTSAFVSDIAHRNGLSNTQLLRLSAVTRAQTDARQSVIFDDIAKQIKEDDLR